MKTTNAGLIALLVLAGCGGKGGSRSSGSTLPPIVKPPAPLASTFFPPQVTRDPLGYEWAARHEVPQASRVTAAFVASDLVAAFAPGGRIERVPAGGSATTEATLSFEVAGFADLSGSLHAAMSRPGARAGQVLRRDLSGQWAPSHATGQDACVLAPFGGTLVALSGGDGQGLGDGASFDRATGTWTVTPGALGDVVPLCALEIRGELWVGGRANGLVGGGAAKLLHGDGRTFQEQPLLLAAPGSTERATVSALGVANGHAYVAIEVEDLATGVTVRGSLLGLEPGVGLVELAALSGDAPISLQPMDGTIYATTRQGRILWLDGNGKLVAESNVPGVASVLTVEAGTLIAGVHSSSTALEERLPLSRTLSIASASPQALYPFGGDSVRITGSNFVNVTQVTVGGVALTNLVVKPREITGTTGKGGSTGPADVVVTSTTAGTVTASGLVSFLAAPALQVKSIAPMGGSVAGGTPVTISGQGFFRVSQVTVGGVPLSSLTFTSDTITGTTGAHGAGLVDVIVSTTAVGSTTATGLYTYGTGFMSVGTVTPAFGLTTGGTKVEISGTNFQNVTSVEVGGAPLTILTTTATRITGTTGAHAAAGPVSVTIQSSTAPTAIGKDLFTYVLPMVIGTVTPSTGTTLGGTSITIAGSNFAKVSAVTLDGVALAKLSVTPTSITGTTAAHATGKVDLVVTSSIAGSVTKTNAFEYVAPTMTITSISPTSGPIAGGTAVTIVGTNFANLTSVKLGGTAITGMSVTPTQITGTTAAHAAGLVELTVASSTAGSVTKTNAFTYNAPPLTMTITSISPTSGPIAGGTSVTIVGTNFANVTSVKLGGTAITGMSVTPTQITGTTAAHAAGLVELTVASSTAGSVTKTNAFTYNAPPLTMTITSISPTSGPIAGGTSVTIVGTNFANVTSVKLGGTAITGMSVTPTQITGTTAAHAAGLVELTIASSTAGSVTKTNAFTYNAPPLTMTITSISPTSGPIAGGTSVTIVGTNFTSISSVKLGGTAITGLSVTATQITGTTAAHAAGLVELTIASSTAGSVTKTNAFTYNAPPPAMTITSISPTSGPIAGGTSVTIVGTNFANVTSVKLGGTAITGMSVTPTQITGTTAAHAAGLVELIVASSTAGSVTKTNAFTYNAPPPAMTITSISPTSGPIAGGTSVTIVGTNFASISSVKLGGTALTGLSVTATQITGTTGAHAAGLIELTIASSTAGSVTKTNAFTYNAPPPAMTITSISPTSGPIAGGTSVTIVGTNFASISSVKLGGTAITGLSVTATQITGTTGAHAAGLVELTIASSTAGSVTKTNAFTYNAPPPAMTITSISPTSGPIAGGTSVTIVGTNFTSISSVKLGGTALTGLSVTATQITGTTGAHAAGLVELTIASSTAGSVTKTNAFTYNAPPPAMTITSISPTSGPIAGGTSVTIVGTNFANVTSVKLGGTAITGVSVTPTQITGTTAAHAAGLVELIVASSTAGSVTKTNAFTYNAPPPAMTITSISPTSGPIAGGTSVTIVGTNFTSISSVKLGGTALTGLSVTATQITGTTGAHAAGLVNLVVASSTAGSVTKNNAFTYNAPALSYATDIQPILAQCLGCHGATAFAPLTTYAQVRNGTTKLGATPATYVTPGSATNSLIVVKTQPGGSMAGNLTPAEAQLLKDWVLSGANP